MDRFTGLSDVCFAFVLFHQEEETFVDPVDVCSVRTRHEGFKSVLSCNYRPIQLSVDVQLREWQKEQKKTDKERMDKKDKKKKTKKEWKTEEIK